MTLKTLFRPMIRRCLRCAGFVVARADAPGARYIERPPKSAFEGTLHRIFPSLRGLSFLQVGANDGLRADPLAPFIDAYGWSGLMIEPLPHHFADLHRLRGGNPRIRLRRAAIDAAIGRRTIYDLREGLPGLPEWAHGLASFDRVRVTQAAHKLGFEDSAVCEHEVDTIMWEQAWREFGARRCDLLVIDTEGYDIALLRLAHLAAHLPRLIHFEHVFASLDERLAFYRELIGLGYELATHEGDTIAHRPESDE